jgi:hypothetical protein
MASGYVVSPSYLVDMTDWNQPGGDERFIRASDRQLVMMNREWAGIQQLSL